ncbi:MAG: hypothetical protein M0Q21_12160 [Ignavibacteriaceae bacterium]|nr:hypothetical protein [Ignavibacteriaceae bacterium]
MSNNDFPDPALLLSDPSFNKFNSMGLIDPIALRNFIIKSEYRGLRKKETQIESIFLLSEKHHLSYDAINTILFRRRTRIQKGSQIIFHS